MAQVRSTAIAQVYSTLECSSFGLSSFDVQFPDGKNEVVVITFLPRKLFFFSIGLSRGSAENLYVRMSPGEFKSEDFLSARASFDHCLAEILPWLQRISEDLRVSISNLSDLSEFRDALEAHIQDSIEDEDSPFSTEEISEIDLKLSALEQRLNELEERHGLAELELAELRQAVSTARTDLTVYPKGIWYRTAGGKLWEVMKKVGTSKEAREILTSAARKLLGL